MDNTEVPNQELQLCFGLQPPAGAVRAWGARAIYGSTDMVPYIDLLWDRQSYAPESEREDGLPPRDSQAFMAWVNHNALPWLREYVKRTWLSNSVRTRVAMVDGQYAIAANPNGSFGYLYIVAYQMPEGIAPSETPTPTPEPMPAVRLPRRRTRQA